MLIQPKLDSDSVYLEFNGGKLEREDLDIAWEDMVENFDIIYDQIKEDLFYIKGSSGLWNGEFFATPDQLIRIISMKDILNIMGDGVELAHLHIIVYNNYNIDFSYSHHDGTNSYQFISIENLSDKEILDIHHLNDYTDKDIKEFFEEYDLKWNRENLIDFFYQSGGYVIYE